VVAHHVMCALVWFGVAAPSQCGKVLVIPSTAGLAPTAHGQTHHFEPEPVLVAALPFIHGPILGVGHCMLVTTYWCSLAVGL
jgi:hypothetical protein